MAITAASSTSGVNAADVAVIKRVTNTEVSESIDGFQAVFVSHLDDFQQQVTKQIDYILMSNRWVSSVKDVNVRWGPSEHRNIYGRARVTILHMVGEKRERWQ